MSKFEKGMSGNPTGRPQGARNRLGNEYLENLAADFAEHGAQVIRTVRETDPSTYFTTIGRLLPKELLASVQVVRKGALDPAEYDALRDVLALLDELKAQGGTIEIADRVARAIRAEFARPIAALPPPSIAPCPIELPNK
jgi:hypothetical protein